MDFGEDVLGKEEDFAPKILNTIKDRADEVHPASIGEVSSSPGLDFRSHFVDDTVIVDGEEFLGA